MTSPAKQSKTTLDDHQRLRLRPVVRFVPLEDQRWSIWIGTQMSQLNGAGIGPVLPDLLELLDGEREVGAVVQTLVQRHGIAPGVVRELLTRFYDWLIVDDDSGYRGGADDGDLAPFTAQLRYLALGSSMPVVGQRRLTTSRVAVLGLSGIGEHVALALAGAGVRHLILPRGEPVTAEDRGAFPYAAADCGRPAGEALAEHLTRLRPDTRPVLVADEEAVDLEAVDLVVLAVRDLHAPRTARINDRCVAARRPLLAVGIDMIDAFVGPLVVPHESPCLACVSMRLRQTESELAQRMRPRPAHVEPTPLAAVVANLAALEAVKQLSGLATATVLGVQLHVDARWLSVSSTDFVRHPRCPTCGPLVAHAPRVVFDVAASLRDPHEG